MSPEHKLMLNNLKEHCGRYFTTDEGYYFMGVNENDYRAAKLVIKNLEGRHFKNGIGNVFYAKSV